MYSGVSSCTWEEPVGSFQATGELVGGERREMRDEREERREGMSFCLYKCIGVLETLADLSDLC